MAHDIVAVDTQTVFNVNMTNVSKLSTSNFLMWSRQVHAMFDGYSLSGYLDGSVEVPSPTILTNDAAAPNPAFTLWKKQDKLIYAALLGAISVEIQPTVSRATTAAEIWTKLNSTYATPSRGHTQQLKEQIKHWKKGNMSIDNYVNGLTTRFDQLALFGKEIEPDDQLDHIFNGLPEDYKSVIDQLNGRETTPTLGEVHEKLLRHEAKLLTAATAASSSLPVTANAVNYKGNGNNNSRQNQRSNYNNRSAQTWQQQQQFSPRPQQRGPRPYNGKCQICSVFGHSARRCPQLQYGNVGNMNQFSQGSAYAPPWQPRANVASATPYNANNWLLDSGATHHLTSDLNNLSLHQPYMGGEAVTIADGSGLEISHTGSTFLSTPTRSLALKDVLYVPNVHKNLISVYRMCNGGPVTPREN